MKETGNPAAIVKLAQMRNVLARVLEMLDCGRVAVEASEDACYRPPLDGNSQVARFPAQICAFSSPEENRTLYRLIAAQHAGRKRFGSLPSGPDGFLAAFPDRHLARWLFLVLDGARVDAALARLYRGLAADLERISRLAGSDRTSAPAGSVEQFMGAVEACWPECLSLVEHWISALRRSDAGVLDSARATVALYLALNGTMGPGRMLVPEPVALAQGGEAGAEEAGGASAGGLELNAVRKTGPPDGNAAQGGDPGSGKAAQGSPLDLSRLSLEELIELVRSAARRGAHERPSAQPTGQTGVFLDGIPHDASIVESTRAAKQTPGAVAARGRKPGACRGSGWFAYDEWDYELEAYRSMWCRLSESAPADGDDSFFAGALRRHSALLAAVRRQFQQIKPEGYRTLRRLEEGEDFDLSALVDAWADRHAGHAPSQKLYTARRPAARDVATLFLLDMSASTDEQVACGGQGKRRVIDIIKEAVVVMADALEHIGDGYAIYGFSGHGRHQVETFVIKPFDEPLSPKVKGRIGAVGPKRSTRMGAALRHAIGRMRNLAVRSKNIILLSDGFPQDIDYGSDRRSNVYGIRDTMMALREARQAGIRSFCVTVDKAGHDYLGEMCERSRYLVIEDVRFLPRELPKIYRDFTHPWAGAKS